MFRLIALPLVLTLFLILVAIGQEPTPQTSVATKANERNTDTDGNCGCGEIRLIVEKPCSPPCYDVGPKCHCVQQKFLNLPGPNDIYYCLSFNQAVVCGEQTPAEEYWYGAPQGPLGAVLPQHCQNDACEPHVDDTKGGSSDTAEIPHHGMRVVESHTSGEDTIEANSFILPMMRSCYAIDHSVSPEYYTFRGRDLGLDRDVPVMAVPVVVRAPGSPHHGNTRYVCIELHDIDSSTIVEEATAENGRSCQLTVKYRVDADDTSAEPMIGLIWLQYPRN